MLGIFIIGYLGINLVIGFFANRLVRNASDFAVAGKQLSTIVCATALFATWFGSETVLGASSEFASRGVLGVIEDPFGAALCLLVIGLVFAKPFYRLNVLTFNDFFRLKFGKAAELISSIIMIPSYLGWIAAQLVALGIILDIITGMGVSVGILISTFMVLSYTLLGGMWAVTITDLVQTIIIIVGLLVVAVIFTERAGGIYPIISSAPKGFFSFLPQPNWISRWEYFASWITVGLGSVPQQDVFQRIMSAKSEKVTARSALVAAGMYLSIALIPLYLVLALMYLYPSHFDGDLQYALPRSILEHTNLPIQVLFFGALVSAIMSTCSGAILAPATVLAENIVKPLYSRDISDRSMLRLLRVSVFFIGIAALCMAQASNNIYELVAESSAISLVTLFVPMIYGLYFSKVNTLPAIFSMVLGTCFWFLALSYSTEYPPVLLGLGGSFCGLLIGILGQFIRK